jgi:uncharacterized protein
MPLESIRTPCVGICELVVALGTCKGCGRTRGEIEAWVGLSDEERELIMEILKERKAEHGKN